MFEFISYAFPVIFILALGFILFIWATVLKGSLPFFKQIWFPSKNDKLESEMKNKTDGIKNYDCDNCGARLGKDAEVSPSGDVKCKYCNKWFNIYRNA